MEPESAYHGELNWIESSTGIQQYATRLCQCDPSRPHAGGSRFVCTRFRLRVRRADVLAGGQGRAPLRRRHACRRHDAAQTRGREDPRSDVLRRCRNQRPRLLSKSPDARHQRSTGLDPAHQESDPRVLEARNRPLQFVHRARLDALGRRKLAALFEGVEAARPIRRGPRRAHRHRELPHGLHRRRMARREEPGLDAGHLAPHVRGDPPTPTSDSTTTPRT